MTEKYVLTDTQEQILFEKNLSGIIYSAGKFENLSTSLLQTEEIVEQGIVQNVSAQDVEIILNTKHAFEYVTTTKTLSYDDILHVNLLVRGANSEDAGNIRHVNVKVAMTNEDYVPPILDSDTTKRQFATIVDSADSWTMKAINLMLVISKMQWFLDGNKRTGLIAANALLYQHNAGILTIPDSKFHWYMSYLKKYYATGNVSIKNWLYDNAIFGM